MQATYSLELDRLGNRHGDDAVAPKWWLGFQYKLVQTLKDERGSICASGLC